MTSNSSNLAGHPTRRTVLAAGAAVAGLAAFGAAPRRALGASLDGSGAGASLYSIVEGYSQWPIHRTGTSGQSAASFGPNYKETAAGVQRAEELVSQALAEVPDKITATIQRGAETEAANAARARSLGRGGSSTTSGSA